MIWVIGDIHGMFDPLKRIMSAIQDLEVRENVEVEKIIFLGDYIDHGPSSREVIDLIMRLDYDKICLMGNHEDLALRYICNDKISMELNGDAWFNNGYLDTYKSIYDRRDEGHIIKEISYKARNSKYGGFLGEKNYVLPYKGTEVPRKYVNFMKSLRYSHDETFKINGKNIMFSFFHALPNPNYPISDQKIVNFRDFNKYLLEKSKLEISEDLPNKDKKREIKYAYLTNLEQSSLWRRHYSEDLDFHGQVIVHGHTPTIYLKDGHFMDRDMYLSCHNQCNFILDSHLPFIYTHTRGAQYHTDVKITRIVKGLSIDDNQAFDTEGDNGIEAINIDTGAVYGGALTALGLSAESLENGVMPLLTVPTAGNQRNEKTKYKFRSIKFTKLGRKKTGRQKT
jgi:hypothetical protein